MTIKLTGVLAIAAVTLALTACSSADTTEPEGPKFTEYEQALLDSDIAVGDCIDSDWSETFKEVPCDTEHSDEVYSIVEFTSGTFKADREMITNAYYTPVSYQSYIGGELPPAPAVEGVEVDENAPVQTDWAIKSHSFYDSEKLWDAGFKKSIFTVTTGLQDAQVGSVKGVLAE